MPVPEPALAITDPPSAAAAPWALGWCFWRWERIDLIIGVVLAVLLVVRAGLDPVIVPGVPLALATPVLWRVDVDERRLPNALVLPIGGLAAGGVVALGVRSGAWLVAVLLAVGGTLVFFLLLSVGGGMGMGDVKLAVVLATVLGPVRVDAIAAAALVAFLSGGVAALAVHVRSRRRSIPFGPFLLAGFWVALVLAT
jgi:leader peptidase (prepilin peptidase)/N-methyltransferase